MPFGEKEEYFEKILTFQSHSGAFFIAKLRSQCKAHFLNILVRSAKVVKTRKGTILKRSLKFTLKFNHDSAKNNSITAATAYDNKDFLFPMKLKN